MLIQNMTEKHVGDVIEMMRVFYNSPAVHTNGSEEIFRADVENCINDNPYLEGFVFVCDNAVAGYGMLAKSFSTEFGKQCIWIEDIYVKESYRSKGIATAFLKFAEQKYPKAILRLEAEEENQRAVQVYKKNGFEVLPYMQMKKESK